MALSLLQNYRAVTFGSLSVPFGASGGSAPYVFSVLPGGAGGTIGSSTGIYVSPASNTGLDVIQVTDASANVVTGSILVCTALELVCDVIQTSMGLANDQVYLYNQKYNIPPDSRLYVAVGVNYCKPFGNRPKYVGGSSTLAATQSVNMLANLSIHIFSRSTAALNLKEQVLLALSSPYAESQMELNSFFIAPLTTGFTNIGVVDGAAIPYHFYLSANLQYFSTLTTNPSYFGSFQSVDVITDGSPVIPTVSAPGPFSILIAEDVDGY